MAFSKKSPLFLPSLGPSPYLSAYQGVCATLALSPEGLKPQVWLGKYTNICTHRDAHISIHKHAHTHTHTIYIYVCVYSCRNTVHTDTHMCMHTYMHTCTQARTYTHERGGRQTSRQTDKSKLSSGMASSKPTWLHTSPFLPAPPES